MQGRKSRTGKNSENDWLCLQKHGPRLESGVRHQQETRGGMGSALGTINASNHRCGHVKRRSMLRVDPHQHGRERRIFIHPVTGSHIGLTKVRMDELVRNLGQLLTKKMMVQHVGNHFWPSRENSTHLAQHLIHMS